MGLFEFEELMAAILEVDDDNWDDIPDKFFEKYEIDFDNAYQLVQDLLPLCAVGKSPLTDTVYQGFAKDGVFIVKREVKHG